MKREACTCFSHGGRSSLHAPPTKGRSGKSSRGDVAGAVGSSGRGPRLITSGEKVAEEGVVEAALELGDPSTGGGLGFRTGVQAAGNTGLSWHGGFWMVLLQLFFLSMYQPSPPVTQLAQLEVGGGTLVHIPQGCPRQGGGRKLGCWCAGCPEQLPVPKVHVGGVLMRILYEKALHSARPRVCP